MNEDYLKYILDLKKINFDLLKKQFKSDLDYRKEKIYRSNDEKEILRDINFIKGMEYILNKLESDKNSKI